MSELYMDKFSPNHSSVLTGKAHQSDRQCFVCRQPIADEQAKVISLDDVLKIKVHPSCWSGLVQELNEAEQQIKLDSQKQRAHQPAAMQANPRVPVKKSAPVLRKSATKRTWVTVEADDLAAIVRKGLLTTSQLIKLAEDGAIRPLN